MSEGAPARTSSEDRILSWLGKLGGIFTLAATAGPGIAAGVVSGSPEVGFIAAAFGLACAGGAMLCGYFMGKAAQRQQDVARWQASPRP